MTNDTISTLNQSDAAAFFRHPGRPPDRMTAVFRSTAEETRFKIAIAKILSGVEGAIARGPWGGQFFGDQILWGRAQTESANTPSEVVKWNDAIVHGSIDDEILDAPIEISFSGKGEATQKGRWLTKTGTVRTVFDWLSKHEVGVKDGMCMLQGALVGGDRNAAAMRHIDFLCLDIDNGEPLENIHQKVRRLGVVALCYTTHSHMKTTSEIKRDALVKWIGGDGEDDPTTEQAISYLLEVKGYYPPLLDGAEISGVDHTPRGVMVFVKHKPMPKARVVFVLAERFSFAKGGTQAERTKIWKESYAGVAKMMGLAIDKSCMDLPRLLFLPRHAKGAPFQIDIFPGEYLDLNNVPRVTAAELREMGANPFADAAKEMGGGKGGSYETDGLKWFFGKYGSRFDLAEFLLEVDPDGDRGGRTSGPGRTHRCPNDDAHTDAGNPDDKGFFCVNADDSETGQAVAKCMHAGCADLDRINFVDLACQAAGIKTATDLMKWVPELVGEDRDAPNTTTKTETAETAPEASSVPHEGLDTSVSFLGMDDARAAMQDVTKDDDDLAIDIARKIGASTSFSAAQVEGLLKKLSKASGIGMRSLEAERKAGVKSVEAEVKTERAKSPLDDEGMRLLGQWNSKYAVVTLGGKVRILQEPTKPGTLPPLFEIDAFRTLKANEKVLTVTPDNEVKQEPLCKHWLEWPQRRTFEGGIVFEPKGARKDEYNLWRGYPVKGKAGDWSLLDNHLRDNICQGNDEYYHWSKLWLAQMFQQPGVKPGSAFVVKGKRGTGKSKLFDWVREAMGHHALKVNRKSNIVGNFNSHQSGVILMVCEEAFWAGDPEAGGVLKDLITSNKMMMEKKGLDAVEVSNYIRLAMISNEDWVVPAGGDDERRFFVLECGDGRRQDVEFFKSIDKQMEAGGLEAMVHDLLTYQPSEGGWDVLRTPPVTPWLREQAEQGISPGERFFVHLVEEGSHTCHDADGKFTTTLELHEQGTTKSPNGGVRWVDDAGTMRMLLSINELRHHYRTATNAKVVEARHGRATGDDAMFRYAERILKATKRNSSGNAWQWKEKGKCYAVLPRDVLLRNPRFVRMDFDDNAVEQAAIA